MRTEDLIAELAARAAPVRRLAPPGWRLAGWLALSLPLVALVVLAIGLRPDLAQRLTEARWLAELGLALLTALAAGLAALTLVVPGRSARWALLPVLPGGLWLSTLGAGCVLDWQRLGPSGLGLTPDAECLVYISLIGALPAMLLLAMLRRGAPLLPMRTGALGALAAAALGAVGLRLFHTQDLALMVLVWQIGSVLLLVLAAALAGRRLLRWAHLQREEPV